MIPLFLLAAVAGALNPAVTQGTIGQTICVRGWTATVRPPKATSEAIKRKLLAAKGHGSLSDYELDHAIPLELGGAPSDLANLWLEPHKGKYGSYAKDRMENRLRQLVCSGTITLDEGRHEIWPHWIRYYHLRIAR